VGADAQSGTKQELGEHAAEKRVHKNRAPKVGGCMLPSVTKAKYVNDYLIEVKFNDGTKKVIDFEGWLSGPVFKPLRNKDYFKKFFIDGPTIAWPNGADIAPETLYEAAAVEVIPNQKMRRTG
jgi:hypothetical protein